MAGNGAINSFALYLALSGWRVWARREAIATQQPQRLDQVLAVVELVACGVFMLAFWQLIQDLGLNPWLRLSIPLLAVLPVMDAGNDLIQATWGVVPALWWLQHLRKLAMAEAGLLAAIALRCTPEPYVIWGMAGSLLVIAIPSLWLVRHQLRNP